MANAQGKVRINNKWVGPGEPTYIIAEIGINHNGCMDTAKKMIESAAAAGCDAVKFQKRTPELCVPKDQWNIERDTPWGRMTYIDYRHRVEFSHDDYQAIDRLCRKLGIDWFASCWDEEAVDFIEKFAPPAYKIASASITDHDLLRKIRATQRPVILSTGMSTLDEVDGAVEVLGTKQLLVAHATSAYPCRSKELNLRMIQTLQRRYPGIPVGYSGHELGSAPTIAAMTLGACFVERHITLDRNMWGTDQSASLDVPALQKLVAEMREIEESLGDGIKRVYESELSAKKKLRRVTSTENQPVRNSVPEFAYA